MFYGFGAFYDNGTVNNTESFIHQGLAYIGWNKQQSPSYHQMLSTISVGSIVFIKSFSPRAGLYIKAIGIVKSDKLVENDLGTAREVKWLFAAKNASEWLWFGRLDDKMDCVRGCALYIEFHEQVQKAILDKIARFDRK
ncbi:hypothetical protein B7982_12860 [Fibrobacter sp. UWB2]|uniref:hypothetical protein n=1 Tax=Fibrobacter sp. UWB2 TaxID=1964358 RepID=UPI000B5220C1|nr:hypothetical protein [Fibrobacter sp. UWB2]OWV21135.1 hypothetical protein B7982_12860 [Fibrobacter sp. UWB2]